MHRLVTVWYHEVFIIQTKSGQINNFMYSKMKGEFKYQNMETKIK